MKKKVRLLSLLLVFLLLALAFGCGAPSPPGTSTDELAKQPSETSPTESSTSPAQRQGVPGNYNEAPALGELVASGALPAVEERLPVNPVVVHPISEVGQYGGKVSAGLMGMADIATTYVGFITEGLVSWDRDTSTIKPNIAESWTVEDGACTYVFKLRESMKWSDGTPFTTDDIMFFYNDVLRNESLTLNPPAWLKSGGKVAVFEAVDNLTFKVKFTVPNSTFIENIAFQSVQLFESTTLPLLKPKHYLSQFHPNYTSQDELDRLTREEGFTSWTELFQAKSSYLNNPELPKVSAWLCTTPLSGSTLQVMERNPYYFKVDPAGNQLPYIDEVHIIMVETPEAIVSQIISGDIDFEVGHLVLPNYSILKQNEGQGDYKTYLWDKAMGSQLSFWFNVSHTDQKKKELFNNIDFRRAMSLAINRKRINDTCFMGLATPRHSTIVPDCEYFTEGMDQFYVEYDPETANRMLDAIGMTQRDAEGFRRLPDNTNFTLTIEYFPSTEFGSYDDMMELVREDWGEVGIRVVLKSVDRALYETRVQTTELDVITWSFGRGKHPLIQPIFVFPFMPGKYSGSHPYSLWYSTSGADGEKPNGDYLKCMELYDKYKEVATEEEKLSTGKEICLLAAENMWSIGTVGMAPTVTIAPANMGNVPEHILHEWVQLNWNHVGPEQLYYK